MWIYNQTDTLYHHGVMGMKWGVHRYQNKYGALTPAGQKHRDKLESKYEEVRKIGAPTKKGQEQKARIEAEYKALTGTSVATAKMRKAAAEKRAGIESSEKKTTKTVKEMSDSELQSYVNRLANEQRYESFVNPQRTSKGKEIVGQFGQAALKGVTGATTSIIQKQLTDYVNDKISSATKK